RNRVLRDLPVHRDPPDTVTIGLASVHLPCQLDEPHVAVRAGRDVAGTRVRARQIEFGDLALGRDASDLAGVELREPDVAVGPGRERPGTGVRRRDRELRDLALRSNPADLSP